MVYVGPGEQGGRQLWLRRRDQLQATPIAGTEGALNPVFSPDGRRVAFRQGAQSGGVRVVSLSGGPPLAIVESGVGPGGLAWGPGGYIYFQAPGWTGLFRVPETSGEVEPFTVFDTAQSETGHAWPQALPNGRGVLFTVYQPGGDFSPVRHRGGGHGDRGARSTRGRRVRPLRGLGALTLPWFDVHQNADNFLMNGGRNGQEEVGSESTVHR